MVINYDMAKTIEGKVLDSLSFFHIIINIGVTEVFSFPSKNESKS